MSVEDLDAAIEQVPGGAAALVTKIYPRAAQRQFRPPPSEVAEPPAPRKLRHVLASEMTEITDTFDDELIEGVIGRNAMAVIYGDSNSGKTFFAVELSARLNLLQPFLGRNTAGGLVIYLATEAAGSVQLRFQAWRKHHGVVPPGVVIVQSPVSLFDGDADVTAVLALIEEVEGLFGEKVALIVGDTLARISAGANENSGEDMGIVLKHADAIRAATGATFCWVHHCGKDAAKGMRGWSGMRAAIDTEIEVTEDASTGVRTAEITKQRDLPGKGDRLTFRLQPLELGKNIWGSPRGSCVVVADAAEPDHVSGVMHQVARRHAEDAVKAAFHALAAMGIKTTDEARSRDCLVTHMLEKGLADGHDKQRLRAALGRLMAAGIFRRGPIDKYGNGTVRNGLVLVEGASR